jgi:hypothetical protein
VADIDAWAGAVCRLLDGRDGPARRIRLERAAGFTWANHARVVLGAYRRLAEGRL